ncbi:MAG: cytochrome c3 family protein [Caldilineaceae bacterium]|nr:cytochrome c3 family protein [Caldilineaceae bacterium]
MKRLMLLASLSLCFVFLIGIGTANAAASDPMQVDAMQEDPATQPLTETVQIPFLSDWMASAHADFTAEAFTHWNEDDPAEVPTRCAKCHSSEGYIDYLGADGTEVNVVDNPAPVQSVVACVTCHNDATQSKTSVIMPSGIELTNLGDEARCMECHQGRNSTVGVNAAIEEAAVTDPDEVSDDLGFQNIHYYAAAATKYGTLAKGGYEYDGKSYDANFAHVEAYESCIDCHNSHTLEVKLDGCTDCHEDVAAVEDLRDVRMAGSEVDYDGDGDIEEGIYYELTGLQEALYAAIQAYAAEVAGSAVVYDSHSHPYFFIDSNEDGATDEEEVSGDNSFASWTPRLVKAAYNYQTSMKDPGAYAHGGKYIIELLYDSIEDLNSALAEPVDLSEAHRIDHGHFAGSEEAFRHWDEEGVVPGSCAKCHSASGLPTFLSEGVNISAEPSNGFQCTTCHNDLQEFTLYEVEEVEFPSGAVLDIGDPESNICANCHQGRESGESVAALIGDAEDDVVADNLRFLNVHYFAAAATRFGSEANGAYEYADKEYAGLYDHAGVNSCTDCHPAHELEVDWESCIECHEEVEVKEDMEIIRYYFDDWDGDGDDEEGIAEEVATMRDELYAAMQAYATETVGTGIVYESHSHPYYFTDTNGNGEADPDEVNRGNQYNTWTPRLLRAAYNYQYVQKDPGAYTHNPPYILQVLYDSIEDIGGDVGDMMRP